ncbi:MAG: hypothetical protein WCD53_07585 [Microcoleus sp.]
MNRWNPCLTRLSSHTNRNGIVWGFPSVKLNQQQERSRDRYSEPRILKEVGALTPIAFYVLLRNMSIILRNITINQLWQAIAHLRANPASPSSEPESAV